MECGDESRDEYIGQAFVALKTKSIFDLPTAFPFGITPVWARTMQLAGFQIKAIGGAVDHVALLTQIKTTTLGYQTHLGALQAWIRREQGETGQTLDQCFVVLRERDPGNLFYDWLRSGATKEIVDKFIAWAPSKPVEKQAEWPYEKPPNEYTNTTVHSAAIVFMANLLIR